MILKEKIIHICVVPYLRNPYPVNVTNYKRRKKFNQIYQCKNEEVNEKPRCQSKREVFKRVSLRLHLKIDWWPLWRHVECLKALFVWILRRWVLKGYNNLISGELVVRNKTTISLWLDQAGRGEVINLPFVKTWSRRCVQNTNAIRSANTDFILFTCNSKISVRHGDFSWGIV